MSTNEQNKQKSKLTEEALRTVSGGIEPEDIEDITVLKSEQGWKKLETGQGGIRAQNEGNFHPIYVNHDSNNE